MLEKSLSGRWTYKGLVTNSELNALYNDAYALIYPSDYEGFGLPLLEAMRAGCPVVCSRSTSLPEVGGEAALYAARQVAAAYAEELEKLRNDSRRRDRVQMGFAQASKFSWDACVKRTLEVYREVLG